MGQSNEEMYEQEAAAAAPQASTYDFGEFPEDLRAKTSDNNGEVAMSTEETNRVREKLGMKPLRTGESDRDKARREVEEEGHLARLEAEKEKETKALALKIAAAKERRLMESRNRSTRQLGESEKDAAADDLSEWVKKSRKIEETRKKEEKRKAQELARKLEEQDEDAEEDESDDDDDMFGAGGRGNKRKTSGGGYSSKELAGLKVRHGADEVMEGETMILTLKDSSILDNTRIGINEETDELENVLLAEEKQRKKARAAATKTSDTPFGTEEEETDKTVLSKYDDKEDEEALTLDGSGGIGEAEQRRKEEIRRKLAASLGGAPVGAREDSAMVERRVLADYLTASEVAEAAAAKFNKPKKRRKKLRERKVDAAELEADSLAPVSTQLGSRRQREEEGGDTLAAASAAERAEKDERFARAINKAKMQTDEKILAELAGDLDEESGGRDEEDDELERALARSRRLAAKGTTRGEDAVVAAAAARREKDAPLAQTAASEDGVAGLAEAGAEGAAEGEAEGIVFSDMQEFIHGINMDDRRAATAVTAAAAVAAAAEPASDGGDNESSEMPAVPPPPPGSDPDAMDVDPDPEGMPPVPPPPPPPFRQPQDDHQRSSNLGGIGERSTAGKGLAATLALLKDTGKLNENEMWDGRTNDKKPMALQRVVEATELSSGEFDGHKFDFRLDKFDEFGRKMTPKEAFRELCHRFHGIEPGKAKKEKRLKAFQEEVKAKKMSEGDTPLNSMAKMKLVQQMQASPYVVLSGTIHAGQTSDPLSRYATAGLDKEDDEAGPDKGAGGKAAGGLGAAINALPELKGKKKVEFMMKKR